MTRTRTITAKRTIIRPRPIARRTITGTLTIMRTITETITIMKIRTITRT